MGRVSTEETCKIVRVQTRSTMTMRIQKRDTSKGDLGGRGQPEVRGGDSEGAEAEATVVGEVPGTRVPKAVIMIH